MRAHCNCVMVCTRRLIHVRISLYHKSLYMYKYIKICKEKSVILAKRVAIVLLPLLTCTSDNLYKSYSNSSTIYEQIPPPLQNILY